MSTPFDLRSSLVAAAAAVFLSAGCGSSDPQTMGLDVAPDAAPDAAQDVAPGASLDVPLDASRDASLDAAETAVSDGGGGGMDAPAGHDAVASVDAAGDLGAWVPASGRPPPAKGLWIWYFAYTGRTAAEIAQQCQHMGVGYVLLKSGQDANFWTTRYTPANLNEFTSRGIRVLAWPYVTPADIPGSIAAVAQAAAVPGTSGVILDVESEFEGSHAAAAQQLCQGIRARVPGVFLGYTSFGWVGYHGTFPFPTFDQYCGDVFMPQVYWSDRGVTWTRGYDQAVQMIHDAGLHAPVWMIQSNDNPIMGGAAPSTADLNAFFDRAGAYSSLWEWPAAGMNAKVDQLPALHWAN